MQQRFEETIKHVSTMQSTINNMQLNMDQQYQNLLSAIQHIHNYPHLSPPTTQPPSASPMFTDLSVLDPGENKRRQE